MNFYHEDHEETRRPSELVGPKNGPGVGVTHHTTEHQPLALFLQFPSLCKMSKTSRRSASHNPHYHILMGTQAQIYTASANVDLSAKGTLGVDATCCEANETKCANSGDSCINDSALDAELRSALSPVGAAADVRLTGSA